MTASSCIAKLTISFIAGYAPAKALEISGISSVFMVEGLDVKWGWRRLAIESDWIIHPARHIWMQFARDMFHP